LKRIFISGPFTAPDRSGVYLNIANAINAAEELSTLGVCPFVPHFYDQWDYAHRHEYRFWMDLCKEELLRSDAMYRLGPSPGADEELGWATDARIPVFHSIEEVRSWLTK
jgi:hypothetical protein